MKIFKENNEIFNGKNIEIQYMRLIAIILVALNHKSIILIPNQHDPLHLFTEYFALSSGVDIFFVISGYLMGVIFIGKSHTANTPAEKLDQTILFFKKRFLRLFPASLFWITVLLLYGIASHDVNIWSSTNDLISKWFMSIVPLRNFENAIHGSHLGWYWSLSLENQFYIILPIIYFLCGPAFFWSFVIFCTISLFFYLPGGDMWPWFRPTGFFWGLLVYKVSSYPWVGPTLRKHIPHWGWVTSLMAITFIFLAVANTPMTLPAFMPLAISTICASTALVLLMASLNAGFIKIPNFLKYFVFWGAEFSYSFYLCHIVVWCIYKDIMKRMHIALSNDMNLITGYSLAMFFSSISYFFIERYFYKQKDFKKITTPNSK